MSTAAAPVASPRLGLGRGVEERRVDAGDVGAPDADAAGDQRLGKRLGERRMRRPAPPLGDHAGRDDDVARRKARIETAGDPEGEHGAAAGNGAVGEKAA